jgi:hypothetical protein
MIPDVDNLQQLDLLSALNSFNDLSEIDPDSNIPLQSNFKYYTPQEFADDHQIINCSSSKCFSALHSNIRSFKNANSDNLIQMLIELNHDFSVIGLTETKYQSSREQLLNVTIPGYNFIYQPSLSNSGGVGFFASDNLSYVTRNDFSKTTVDYEALWIEVQSGDLHHNIICGVIYRHPHSNVHAFLGFLNDTLDKINTA